MSSIDWLVGQEFQRPSLDDPHARGDSELLDALIDRDRDRVEALLVAGVAVGLREAALLGDARRIRRLLSRGADPAPAEGWSPLHLAAWGGQTRAVRALLACGVPVDLAGPVAADCTALHLAVLEGHGPVADALLASGADPDREDAAGWTPLHQAADRGDLAMVKRLVRAGCRVDPLCGDDTPLALALRAGHHAVAALLHQMGGTR